MRSQHITDLVLQTLSSEPDTSPSSRADELSSSEYSGPKTSSLSKHVADGGDLSSQESSETFTESFIDCLAAPMFNSVLVSTKLFFFLKG